MRYDYANGMNRGEYSYDESNEYSGYDNRYAEPMGTSPIPFATDAAKVQPVRWSAWLSGSARSHRAPGAAQALRASPDQPGQWGLRAM